MHSADTLIGRYRAADRFARMDLHGEIETQFGKPFADYVRGVVDADEAVRRDRAAARQLPVRKRQGMGR